MIQFQCDYTEGCHPSILAALQKTNLEQTPGYGTDPYCQQAREAILALCQQPQAQVHFLVGGTHFESPPGSDFFGNGPYRHP